MSEITLQHHRTLWHFVPGLALSAVITGVALWGRQHSGGGGCRL
ncbi:inner membrane protein YeiH [Enterobacter cancerogenus]|uniref:Inner membrane protein YeiH n=1 Tax=Enterobacter cancerogenus TaxID=69218 RepID=A0A484YH33_9ENTR|nr:inner membrane protein YeiH [Enterobacter cancerogenus]